MARARKKKALYVVFDTNAIFTPSDEEIISDSASKLIADHSNHGDIEIHWILPHIVRAEREYQMRRDFMPHIRTSQRVAKILNENWDISAERVSTAISANIDRQLQALNIKVAEPNTACIDWGRVINSAAFRLPPFEPGQKEKGFRDALLCETFLQIASGLAGQDTALLITDDKLATQAVKQRLGNARVLADLNTLRDEIMLRVSNVDAETVAEIEQKATLLFLQENKTNMLWIKKDIYNKIFNDPALSSRIKNVPIGAKWELVSHLVSPTRLVKKEANRVYFQTDYTVNGKSRVWVPSEPTPQAELISHQQSPARLYGLGAAFPADVSNITITPMSHSIPLNSLLGLNGGTYNDTALPPVTIEIHWSATYNKRKALTHAEIHSFHIQQPDDRFTEPATEATSHVGPYL